MSNTVYPLGYSASGSLSRVDELMRQDNMLLIDTRYKPWSRNPIWRERALRERYGGKRYKFAGTFLGNENYQGGPIKLAHPEMGIKGLCKYLDEGYDLILLCQCPDYFTCHRKVIIERLQEARGDVQVVQPTLEQVASDTIPCLSIRQPYVHWLSNPALFIASGIKPKVIENRDWTTRYRGPLLLHASATFEEDVLDYWVGRCPQLEGVIPMEESGYTKKAIVGIADLVDVVTDSDDPWFVGRYGFVLANARPIAPIPWKGMLKLFPVPASIVESVLSR